VTYHPARDSYDTTAFASFEVNLDLGHRLGAVPGHRKPDQMYPRELLAAGSQGGEAGLDATLELHRRLAFSAAAVLLALMGVPLGMQPSRAVRARGLSVSLLVILGYYVLYSAALALARRGVVNAAIAMWIPDALVAAAVCVMLARAAADRSPYPSPSALAHAFAPARRLAPS
jgi:lipopolysaccharide export LptBFGC system permease protein LptF